MPQFLKLSIAVVTCNKIACSSKFENYKYLKSLSRKFNAPFLFETNVGAGLPIIDTLKHLIHSGDKVHKINATAKPSLFTFTPSRFSKIVDPLLAEQCERQRRPMSKEDTSSSMF